MDSFWKNALKIGGTFVVGAFVLYKLYELWLKLPVFSKMSAEHTFYSFLAFLVFTFLTLLLGWIAFIKRKPTHSNTAIDEKTIDQQEKQPLFQTENGTIDNNNNGKFEIVFRSENRNPKKDIEVIHGGIVHWGEKDTDAFWIKLFIKKSNDEPWSKIRVTTTYRLFEVRDYSHMFFSGDNQMSSDLLPDLGDFPQNGIITYNVHEPEKGQELNQFCVAELNPIKCAPARVKIERSLDNVFFLDPYDFIKDEKIEHSQIGIWVVCRSEKFIKNAPYNIEFSVKSNFPIIFLKNQFILPAGSFIEETQCKVSENYFKPWTNSNLIVGQPGWISLVDTSTSEPKHISTFYNIEKPLFAGGGNLAYSSKNVIFEKVIIFNNKLSFYLRSNKTINIKFTSECYLIILILIVYNKESITKPLIESSLIDFVNLASKSIKKSRKKIKSDELHRLIDTINDRLNESFSTYLNVNDSRVFIMGKDQKHYTFPLLSKYIKSFDNIDIEPIVNDYNDIKRLIFNK